MRPPSPPPHPLYYTNEEHPATPSFRLIRRYNFIIESFNFRLVAIMNGSVSNWMFKRVLKS